jgi:predicted RNase H-like nuclease (RuvC/YqgF family)
MSKVLAFQTLRGSIQAAQDGAGDYKKALYLLLSYAAQLTAYKFPTNVQHPPEGWDEAQKTWANLTGTLEGWAYGTLKTVITFPEELRKSSELIILPTLQTAINEAGMLVENPNDTAAKKELLESTLPFLATKFREFSSQTAALVYNLENQATVFDPGAKKLQEIARTAMQEAGADAKTIKRLTADIQRLRADITEHGWAIAGGSIAAVAGVAMGVLPLKLAPVIEGMSLSLLVPAVLITTSGGAYIVGTNTQRIQNDKKKIYDMTNKMNTLNAAITFLNMAASDLQQFASQVDGLRSDLSMVVQPWRSAEEYFTHTINTLNDIENASSEDWQQVQNELQEIENDWNALMTTLSGLQLVVKVYDAQVEAGMEENQVQQALDNGKAVDIIEYIAA